MSQKSPKQMQINDLAVPKPLNSVFHKIQDYYNAHGGKKAAAQYSRHERHIAIIQELEDNKTSLLTKAEQKIVSQAKQREQLETTLTRSLEKLLNEQLQKQLVSLEPKQASQLAAQLKAMVLSLSSDNDATLNLSLRRLINRTDGLSEGQREELKTSLKTTLQRAMRLEEAVESAKDNSLDIPKVMQELQHITKGKEALLIAKNIKDSVLELAHISVNTHETNELLERAERTQMLEQRLHNALFERLSPRVKGTAEEQQKKLERLQVILGEMPLEKKIHRLDKELRNERSLHNGRNQQAHLAQQLIYICTSTPSQTPALLKEFKETIPPKENKIKKFAEQLEKQMKHSVKQVPETKKVIQNEAKEAQKVSDKKIEPKVSSKKPVDPHSAYLDSIITNPLLKTENKVVQLYRLVFFKELRNKDDMKHAKAVLIQLGNERTLEKIPAPLRQPISRCIERLKAEQAKEEHHKHYGVKAMKQFKEAIKRLIPERSSSADEKPSPKL